MFIRIACCLSLFLTGLAVADTPAPDCSKDKHFFSIKLLEQSQSETVKQLVDSSVEVTPEGKIYSFSGGTVSGFQGERDLQFGVLIDGSIKPTQDGKFRLMLKLRVTERVHQLTNRAEAERTAETQLTKTEAVEIRTFLVKGKTKRLSCGGRQSLELRLE